MTTVAVEPRASARRRVSRHGVIALAAMLAPAILFPIELLAAVRLPRFRWLLHLRDYPIELWVIAVCGTAATLGGIADWRIHRGGNTAVGRPEHHAHVAALAGGGIPLFVLMTFASVLADPRPLMLPILVVAGFTLMLICSDEFLYHRRCDRLETFTHRLLTFGNGAAWLAWMHWCFARGAS